MSALKVCSRIAIAVLALAITLPLVLGAAVYAAEHTPIPQLHALYTADAIVLTDGHSDRCRYGDRVAMRGQHIGCWNRYSERSIEIRWMTPGVDGIKFHASGYALAELQKYPPVVGISDAGTTASNHSQL